MAKNKIKRFSDNESYEHVFEPVYDQIASDSFEQKGRWADFFKNSNPITVELGCGKGEYTIGLAELYPDRNYIGVDVKGSRLWVGATYAKDHQLKNVAFVRTRVDFLSSIFSEDEISEIWITFPDPQNKKRKKRLTYPRFLTMYQTLLKHGGKVNLKTDSDKLYQYTKSVAKFNQFEIHGASDDIYNSDILNDELKIRTFYESLFLDKGDNINFLSFELGSDTIQDSEFDEDEYENAVARIPFDKKVIPSKLTD
jgi:tRNA (guanine-N7-)-methyltransferase